MNAINNGMGLAPRFYTPADLGYPPMTAEEAEAQAWRQFHAALVTFIGEQSGKMGAVCNVEWRDIVNGLSDVLSDASHYAERAQAAASEETKP